MMLLKYCSHASKFGKLSSGHRTGKGQFSFQSQRKAIPKNVQITIQLHSFHMLTGLFSKSFKLGLSSTLIENFEMYKLNLEKAEEPEIKLPTIHWFDIVLFKSGVHCTKWQFYFYCVSLIIIIFS